MNISIMGYALYIKGGPLEFHNIQEIVDIELMFELICMFFFCLFILIPNDQEKRKSTVKRRK